METQRILVNGGAGSIGKNLIKELNIRGHEVISIDLFNTDLENYLRALIFFIIINFKIIYQKLKPKELIICLPII